MNALRLLEAGDRFFFSLIAGFGFSPPSDAVQEFKVQTNTLDAQQGYSAGATVNVAVKSGSNDVHGSAWYFNRDRSRNANNFAVHDPKLYNKT